MFLLTLLTEQVEGLTDGEPGQGDFKDMLETLQQFL